MARGGKRIGAGRKQTVDLETTELIWEDCQQRARQLQTQQAHLRIKKKLERCGLQYSHDEEDGGGNIFTLVPTQYRSSVIKYGQAPELPLPDSLPEEVLCAIDTMRENRRILKVSDGASMGFRVSEPTRRIYDVRDAIIDSVAKDWDITPRKVREIWENYRPL